MSINKNAPGTGIVRGGGDELLGGNITTDSVILAARKSFSVRLRRNFGLSDAVARLTVELALGGANV